MFLRCLIQKRMGRDFRFMVLPRQPANDARSAEEYYYACHEHSAGNHERETLNWVSRNDVLPYGVSCWTVETLVRQVNEWTQRYLALAPGVAERRDLIEAIRAFAELASHYNGLSESKAIYINYD